MMPSGIMPNQGAIVLIPLPQIFLPPDGREMRSPCNFSANSPIATSASVPEIAGPDRSGDC